MDAAIQQTTTTELTINGFQGSPATMSTPLVNFYNMDLSNAKIVDTTCSKQLGRQQETKQANSNTNNYCGNNSSSGTISNSSTPTPIVKWTGKNMVMKKGMQYRPEDWANCTQEQKKQNFELRKNTAKVSSTTVSVSITVVHTPTPEPTAPPPLAPTPHPVMTNATDIHHLLSNNTLRDSSSPPSHVDIDGRTYILLYGKRTYSIHHNSQTPSGSIIDGGANGGLSGSDVGVIAETLLTADVTGIASSSLQNVPDCTVAGLIQT
jgi:hypothetical protein